MAKGRSIRSNVFLVTITSTMIVAAFLLVALFFLEAASFKTSLEKKGDYVAIRLQKTLASPLWSYDLVQCRAIVKSELVDRDFGSIAISEPKGGKGLLLEGGQSSDNPLAPSRDPWTTITKPIEYHDMNIGEVRLTITGLDSIQSFATRVVVQGLFVFLVGLIVAGVLFVAVDRSIALRIETLGREIGGFSDRDLGRRATEWGSDEIGDLARTFNSMADSLERYGRDLQGLVDDRTRELAGKNEELVEANRRVEERLIELKRTQDQLIESAKLAEIGRVVAQIVHDLNTPIAAIGSTVELLSENGLEGIARLPRLASEIKAEDLEVVEALLAAGRGKPRPNDFGEIRARRRRAEEILAKSGLAEPGKLATRLVEIDADSLAGVLGPRLASARGELALEIVEAISSIFKDVTTLAEATERAHHVLTSLRNYLHHEASGDDTAPVEPAREIESILVLFANRLRNIEIDRDIEGGCLVRARRSQLGQVMMNLIDNALHSMGDFGRLGILIHKVGDLVEIAITDTGRGVPPEIRDRLFEPFFTTKRQGDGTGLGLAISRRIVEEHGGSIDFSSEAGRTRFSILLPVGST